MFWALLGILIHLVTIWLALEFIEARWPTLHRVIKAAILAAILGALVAIFRTWICGWLCV